MASTKRERSALSTSDDVLARPTKKKNVHCPGGSRSEDNKKAKPHSATNKKRHTHRAMTGAEKRAKQQRLNDQVGFIILTRDNNKPDPYGTVSSTYGPKSWTIVAKAYNEKYSVSVTPAAMEKRARQHRAEWIAKHPAYPTKITYARKNEVHSAPGAGIGAGTTEDRDILRVLEQDASNERSAGWTPPDEVRNASDLRNYIEGTTLADTGSVTIEIFDAKDVLLGTATIDRHILQKNSGASGLLDDDKVKLHIQLHGPLEKILQCYALCTSSTALPQATDEEAYNEVSLVQLYCLAVQLDDDHVQSLVMDRWRLLSAQDKDVEFVLDDLNLLFECTHCSDLAHDAWARSVCAAGLAERLLAMDGCGSALADCLQRLKAEESVGDVEDEEHYG